MNLVNRTIWIKTFHKTHGDKLVKALISARSDRPLDDPFFVEQAKKLAKRHGKLVEWKVME